MKNWLSYYYNMNIDEIHQKDKNYFFEIKQYTTRIRKQEKCDCCM